MVHCHKGYNFTRDFWYYHILCVCAIPIYTIYRLYDECTHILIFYFLFVMVVPSSYIWNITVLFSLKLLSCLCRLLRHSWLSIHMECTSKTINYTAMCGNVLIETIDVYHQMS